MRKRMIMRFDRLLVFAIAFCMLMTSGVFCGNAIAAENTTTIGGKLYEFDEKNDYMFSEEKNYTSTNTSKTGGKVYLLDSETEIISSGTKNGVPSFVVSDGNISITYSCTNTLYDPDKDGWYMIEDKERNVDVLKLEKNILKGAIIVQRSIDKLNWTDIECWTDAFNNPSLINGSQSLYETRDIELINGCYYRVLVVYKICRFAKESSFFLLPDKLEYKRIAEVYEFYAEEKNEHIEELQSNTTRYRLGESKRLYDFENYGQPKEIPAGDIHDGWQLGSFFVSGYTSKTEENGQIVFLKNAGTTKNTGDVVTLWFNLKQNIDAITNDQSLSITADPDGKDYSLGIPKMNFGRGMLIIRRTDDENVQEEPVKYSDFLVANTLPGRNTRVQLFEEGDYEVALDYEVTKDQLVDKVGHYQIRFSFKVRNANCMVFPVDIASGRELTNRSIAKDGFYLDFRGSRYLNVSVKKDIWVEGADGLTEDTRFYTTSNDGKRYTDEGIYTITVKNKYSGLETTKVIYVGTNRVLLAYMRTNYSISEILRLIDQGAIVYEDGSIKLPPKTFTVTYEFFSGTAGMVLPDSVKSVLPSDQAGLEDGADVIPGNVQMTEIHANGGIWKFQGWDAAVKTVDGANLRFVGIWIFEKDVESESDLAPETIILSEAELLPESNAPIVAENPPESNVVLGSIESVETNPIADQDVEQKRNSPTIIGGFVIVAGVVVFLISRKKKDKGE